MKYWEEFTDNVISYIAQVNKKCIFLLLGNFAKSKRNLVGDAKRCVEGVHPSPLAQGFIGSNVFIIYFRILRASGDPHKIKVDITKKENEKIFNPVQEKDILHKYSDIISKKIYVYTLQEIFSEKARSLFERSRPRDLYDVWYINKKIGVAKLFTA